MSLHADLSPEAQAALERQRRNSTVSSVVIAILVVVLLLLILGIIALKAMVRETPTIVTYQTNSVEESEVVERKVSTSQDRRPSSPTSSMAKVIASTAASNVAVPVPDVDVVTPSMEFGDGNGFGTGWGDGNGNGGGGGFAGIPATMKKRCSKADRLARLQESGGTPECEDAVVRGLNWLKANQSADGSWPGGGNHPVAMTGFAILCYLGHCETPLSKEYGDSCLRAITYLVDVGMKNSGKLASNVTDKHYPYEHAIATYALAEAATFCKEGKINIPNLFEVTEQAGLIILNNQHQSGGWDYGYDTSSTRGGDTSISAWHMQALKALKHSKLIKVNEIEKVGRKGLDYIISMQNESGGFGYASPRAIGGLDYMTMTGGGLLCLQQWDKGNHSGARRASKYIEDNTKFQYKSEFADLYGHYYEAQAMMNRGGSAWTKYNEIFRDQLLKNQNPDGSWATPGAGKIRAIAPSYQTNITYRTCLCILMLEVYYRFLPGTGSK